MQPKKWLDWWWIVGALPDVLLDAVGSIALTCGLVELKMPWPLAVGVGWLVWNLNRLRLAVRSK